MSSGAFPLIVFTFSINVPYVLCLCVLKRKHGVQRHAELRDPVCGRDDVLLLCPDHRTADWGTDWCNPYRGNDTASFYANRKERSVYYSISLLKGSLS